MVIFGHRIGDIVITGVQQMFEIYAAEKLSLM